MSRREKLKAQRVTSTPVAQVETVVVQNQPAALSAEPPKVESQPNPAPEQVSEQVPKPTESPAAPADDQQKEAASKSHILSGHGVVTPPARVRHHALDALNGAVYTHQEEFLEGYRKYSDYLILITKGVRHPKVGADGTKNPKASEYTPLTDEEKKAAIDKFSNSLVGAKTAYDKYKALSDKLIRFSPEACYALTIMADLIVRELCVHLGRNCEKAGITGQKPEHLYLGLESLDIWPLISNLEVVVKNIELITQSKKDCEVKKAVESAVSVAIDKTLHEYGLKNKKASDVNPQPAMIDVVSPSLRQADSQAQPNHPPPAHSGELLSVSSILNNLSETAPVKKQKENRPSTFDTYIKRIWKQVKDSNHGFSKQRNAAKVTSQISDIVIAFIAKVSGALVQLIETIGVKTVTIKLIRNVLYQMLVDGKTIGKSVSVALTSIEDPVLKAAEKAKKKADKDYKEQPVATIEVYMAGASLVYPSSCERVMKHVDHILAQIPAHGKDTEEDADVDLDNIIKSAE